MSLDASQIMQIIGWVGAFLGFLIAIFGVPMVAYLWKQESSRTTALEKCKAVLVGSVKALEKDVEHLQETRTNSEQVRQIFRVEVLRIEHSLTKVEEALEKSSAKLFEKLDTLTNKMIDVGMLDRRDGK